MNLPPDHDHDEDGNCIPPEGGFYSTALPTWRFSAWDVVGIGATTVGGLFMVVGQGLNLLARECAAMANFSRSRLDEREAQQAYEAHQRAIGEDIRALVEGPGEES